MGLGQLHTHELELPTDETVISEVCDLCSVYDVEGFLVSIPSPPIPGYYFEKQVPISTSSVFSDAYSNPDSRGPPAQA